MGDILDLSDQRSIKSKDKFKNKLSKGTKKDRFLHKLLQRNEENIKAQKKIEELEKQVDKLKRQLKNN